MSLKKGDKVKLKRVTCVDKEAGFKVGDMLIVKEDESGADLCYTGDSKMKLLTCVSALDESNSGAFFLDQLEKVPHVNELIKELRELKERLIDLKEEQLRVELWIFTLKRKIKHEKQ